MARVKLESYSRALPHAVRQGWAVRGYVKQNVDWIADGNPDSETVRRYRTLQHAIKNVRRLAGIEPGAYHPFIVRDASDMVAGTATVHTGRGVQHPEIPTPTTGVDIDYTLSEHASDQLHLGTVHALLQAAGTLALTDAISAKRAESPAEDAVIDWAEVSAASAGAGAFAVVPMQYLDNRLRGFELACEAGDMARVGTPASLTVPNDYAHPLIDFAKGGQPAQLYYAERMQQ